MAKNMRAMVMIELARRGQAVELRPEDLAACTVEELQELLRVEAAEPRPPGRMASEVRTAVRGRVGISINAAVLQACSAEQLTAEQIVEQVEFIRPGTNKASIYPEIKRGVDRGDLHKFGKAEPFTYRTAPRAR